MAWRRIWKLDLRTRCLLILLFAITPFLIIALGRRTIFKAQHSELHHQFTERKLLDTVDKRRLQLADTAARFTERRRHLRERCENLPQYYKVQNSETAVKQHLTIDENHKLVYCAVEKIGCTFWKRVFQILSGHRNVTDPFEIQGIRAYEGYLTAKSMPFDKIHRYLRTSTKFLFVREPYERLLSGYVDKLFSPNAAYWKFLGNHIVKNFRNQSTSLSEQCGHDVTFSEFVQYFINSQKTNEHRDAHFVPNFEHCRPCEIDYDYVGKLETFEEDTFFILQKFELDNLVKFDNFQHESETDAIKDAADYVYSMKKQIQKCMTMPEALLRAYRKLQIRGIISNEIPFPFPLDLERDISITEYKNALLGAHMRSGRPASRRGNRLEAFVEAYSSLPKHLLNEVAKAISIDAELFGYDIFPKVLQNASYYQPHFEYFSLY